MTEFENLLGFPVPSEAARRTAKPLAQFLVDYRLDGDDFIHMLLDGEAPDLIRVAGKLLVCGGDEFSWRLKRVAQARWDQIRRDAVTEKAAQAAASAPTSAPQT